MPRTPETLVRHELVGSDVRVTAASNPNLVGIEGTVVVETANTLHVEASGRAWQARSDVRAGESRTKQVPKADATFAFSVGGHTVSVDGERLVARPARRTEQTGDSQWR